MISLSEVSKSYFGQPKILDRIHLKLKKGEFLYVIGGSGAGKSTLLRMMATEEAPTSGSVTIFGYSVAQASPSTLRAIRRSLGYVPQDVRLIPDLSVQDNVALSLSLAGRRTISAEARARVQEMLERLGLAAKRHLPAQALSGGEAQRVAVARALIRAPELVIADEPTGGQDRDYTWSLMDMFLKANVTGAAVVIATHDGEIVRRVRKRSAFLKGGHIQVEEAQPCTY